MGEHTVVTGLEGDHQTLIQAINDSMNGRVVSAGTTNLPMPGRATLPGIRMADRYNRGPDSEDPSRRQPSTRMEWERVPPDPDLTEDLGYELLDLEAYRTDEDHILFLPHDEDMLQAEAFIVVSKDDVRRFGE